MRWEEFVGNQQTIARLQNLAALDKSPHALLFIGPEGVGKFLAATIFAKALCCENEQKPCGCCKSCQAFTSKNHPDFFVVKPEGQTIKIEQIRKLQTDVSLAPYLADKRVVIIDKADCMTVQSANSLLKTLEEPTGNAIFILIAASRYQILDTILSRCMLVTFQPIASELLAEALQLRECDDKTANLIAKLADGSFGKALDLIEQEGLDIRNRAFNIMHQMMHCDLETFWQESRSLSEVERTNLSRILLDLNRILRDILILHSDTEGSLVYNRDLIEQLNVERERWSTRKLILAMHEVDHTWQMLKSNVNARLAIEQLFIKLRDLSSGV